MGPGTLPTFDPILATITVPHLPGNKHGSQGARPSPKCVTAFLKMTHGYWEKEGSFSSGVAQLLVAIYSLGCMEKG